MLHGVEHKSCARCVSLKPLADFGVHHATSDELNSYCFDCAAALSREGRARRKGAAA